MLQELFVKDFAIIESLRISFNEGLTMITGETGAGKSILVGAVSLLMGGRATADMIRTGSDEAVAEAVFDVTGHAELTDILAGYGLAAEGGQLLIRRIISRTGKNRIMIGDRLATMQMLVQLSGMLIDISGQYSQQLLLQAEKHIDLLDAYGGIGPLKAGFQVEFGRFQNLALELKSLTASVREAIRQKELFSFQLEEISRARLMPDELERLEQERQIVAGAATLYEKTFGAYTALYENDQSCLGVLKRLLRDLNEASAIDGSLSGLCEALNSNLLGIEDAALSLRSYAEKLDTDPGRLDSIEARLDELHRLKKKYGKSVPELIAYGQELSLRLESIDEIDSRSEALRNELSDCADTCWRIAGQLSAGRMKAARTLQKKVDAELASIGLKKASFSATVTPVKRTPGQAPADACVGLTASGMDSVEFFIAPNQGEDPKPLSRIASGGEISRIVLALKKIIAANYNVPTLLFDEVDAGIGGAVAESVGRKLVEIASSHQVLCITHLPQIACFGTQHLSVSKQVRGGRTLAGVDLLDNSGRIDEISRMLGGIKISEATRKHAYEMLSGAQDFTGKHLP
jgi:DNA repair protein RecN (Recombination protein N)